MTVWANSRSSPKPHQTIREREAELLARADLVFTGGQSLYEAKRGQHDRVYPFPSSVDMAHFRQARTPGRDPADQQDIPRSRLGFYGVLDERLDLDLLAAVADTRPDWRLVIVGPPARPKFDPALLPRWANIHYLGPKPYAELPAYLAGWDAALLPFARNDTTRFISPTKTPSTSRPANRSSRRASATSSAPTGTMASCASPMRPPTLSRRSRRLCGKTTWRGCARTSR